MNLARRAVMLIALCGAACATAPIPRCNPVMVQCNEADYPPITELLPKSPIPPPISAWSSTSRTMEAIR